MSVMKINLGAMKIELGGIKIMVKRDRAGNEDDKGSKDGKEDEGRKGRGLININGDESQNRDDRREKRMASEMKSAVINMRSRNRHGNGRTA